MGRDLGRPNIGMAQEFLDRAQVIAGFEQMRRETLSESMETISKWGLTVPHAQRAAFLPGCNRTPYLAADLIERGMDDGAELQAVAPL